MPRPLIFLSIPGLRQQDVDRMPALQQLVANGDAARLIPSFPAVTWPAQTAMLTGQTPSVHGITGNGFYWRNDQSVEMWTAWNDRIQSPQIWDLLQRESQGRTSAVWFPMLSKGCNADYVCMPAPIHHPDGSESLWCYTKPKNLYGELLEQFGHFPLQNFWGPLANITSTQWIADSAQAILRKQHPDFTFIYLPHLDYAAQRDGPHSPAALTAVTELDDVLAHFRQQLEEGSDHEWDWMVASEYTIVDVDHVVYPNRVLRDAGLLQVRDDEGEQIDFQASQAWSLVDHQFSHVYVANADPLTVDSIVRLFQSMPGIAEVLAGNERQKYNMHHARSGEVILISAPNSWQAYYWWNDDHCAPPFARTVDIHRKPGYDPVELHFDPETKSIPLDASRVRGSHGAPAVSAAQQGVLLTSRAGMVDPPQLENSEVFGILVEALEIDRQS